MHLAPFDIPAAAPSRTRRPRRAMALAVAPALLGLALPYWVALTLFVAGWLAIDGVRLVLSGVDHLGAVLGD